MNYILMEPFKYIGKDLTFLKLKCENNHEWDSTSYNNFINNNNGCRKCGNKKVSEKLTLSQEEAMIKVIDKCKMKEYTLTKDFIYNGNKTYLNLKCKHGHEWNTTNYVNFISNDRGCDKCGDKIISYSLKISQEEAEKRVLKKCLEKNYKLIEPFIYKGSESTYLNLVCDKNHNWNSCTYNNFINADNGCPDCSTNDNISSKKLYILYDDEYELMKIGVSNNPEYRLNSIKLRAKVERSYVKLLKTYENSGMLEKVLHKHYEEYNEEHPIYKDGKTEWFYLKESEIENIDRIIVDYYKN
jgi:hypothetical protein